MAHVKLYESWLNEAKTGNVPSILDSALIQYQSMTDNFLNGLSKYGILSQQIRKSIDVFRNKYLPSNSWKSMNDAPGLSSAIEDFKTLYMEVTEGNVNQLPFGKVLSKVHNYHTSDKIWNSPEIIKAAELLKNGDYIIADSVGASIILSQMAIAVTKGLYYYSSKVPVMNMEQKTLKGVIDEIRHDDIDQLLYMGEDFFSITQTRTHTSYMTPGTHGRTIPSGTYREDYRALETDKITPFVKNLSLDSLLNMAKSETYAFDMQKVVFSILFVGSFVGDKTLSNLESALTFMEMGGPTWYNKILG
jgi:hypothetical protein